MSKKYHLEQLIASLSQGELRQFRLHAQNYSSKTDYLNLFDTYRKGATPQLSGNKLSKNKQYLYNSILESLTLKSSSESIESKVLFLINCAEVLYRKQLPEQSYDHIKKALKIARKHELFGYIIQLIEKEKQIRLFIDTNGERSFDEINQEEEQLITLQGDLNKMRNIHNRLMGFKKKYGYLNTGTALRMKMAVDSMGMYYNPEATTSVRSLYFFLYNMALFNWLQKKHDVAYQYTSQFQNINHTPLSHREYLDGLLEHSTSCVCLGKFEALLVHIDRIHRDHANGIFGTSDHLAIKIFYYDTNYSIMAHAYLGDKSLLQQQVSKTLSGLEYWGDRITVEMRMVINSALKLAYFFLEDFKTAKRVNYLNINNEHRSIREDGYEEAILFELFVVYELGDIDYLESIVNRTKRYYQKEDQSSNNVRIGLSIVSSFTNYLEMKHTEQTLAQNISELLQHEVTRNEQRFSEFYHPYYVWATSKLTGTTLLNAATIAYKKMAS